MEQVQVLPDTKYPLNQAKRRIGHVSIHGKVGFFPVLHQDKHHVEVIRMADNHFIYTEWLDRKQCGALKLDLG